MLKCLLSLFLLSWLSPYNPGSSSAIGKPSTMCWSLLHQLTIKKVHLHTHTYPPASLMEAIPNWGSLFAGVSSWQLKKLTRTIVTPLHPLNVDFFYTPPLSSQPQLHGLVLTASKFRNIYVHVFMRVYARASVCNQRPDIRSRCLPHSFLTLVFWEKASCWTWRSTLLPANESQGSCVSTSLALELQAYLTFLSGCWEWDSDSHACLASTFLTEPSPQSHIQVYSSHLFSVSIIPPGQGWKWYRGERRGGEGGWEEWEKQTFSSIFMHVFTPGFYSP